MSAGELMNSFERYLNILEDKAVDFLPRTPILMQYAAEHSGATYAEFAADYRVLTRANIECARYFGIDQLSCISDPYRETHGFGGKITYITDGPPRSSHPLEFQKTLSVLQKPEPLRSARMLDRIQAVEEYRRRFNHDFSILGWVEGPAAEAADLRNVMNFLIDLIDDQPFISDLMDLCLQTAVQFAKAQIQAGADTIGIGDAIASQISPALYEQAIQPREKVLVQAIHKMGARVKLHICGNITHLLPGISDLGVDILDVDHMVDMGTVRETVGEKVTLSGNLDPVSVIKNGTPEQIKAAFRHIYQEIGNPYMVNAGCEIPSGTPQENLRALCEPIPFLPG